VNPRHSGGDDTVIEDLESMGAPADVIAQYRQEQTQEHDFEVFPENWEALLIFLDASTQWRYRLMATNMGFISERTGLDYTALEAVMRLRRAKDKADAFDRIRTLESAALEAWHKS